MLRALVLLMVASCQGSAAHGGPTCAGQPDRDGDGYPGESACDPDATDCDDLDPDVNPDAVDLCNGVDDDCDPTTADANPGAWFLDADHDGAGGGQPVYACDPPAGHVGSSGDCDDTRADIHPEAIERCGGSDEDCDGRVDEGLDCPCVGVADHGQTWLFCTHPASAWVAEDQCSDMGAQLVRVDDEAEARWLAGWGEEIAPGLYWRVCGSDQAEEGVWLCDDEPVPYVAWNHGEPNDSRGEDCLVLEPPAPGWNDRTCLPQDDLFFICELR
jgi:hypothetical protein